MKVDVYSKEYIKIFEDFFGEKIYDECSVTTSLRIDNVVHHFIIESSKTRVKDMLEGVDIFADVPPEIIESNSWKFITNDFTIDRIVDRQYHEDIGLFTKENREFHLRNQERLIAAIDFTNCNKTILVSKDMYVPRSKIGAYTLIKQDNIKGIMIFDSKLEELNGKDLTTFSLYSSINDYIKKDTIK